MKWSVEQLDSEWPFDLLRTDFVLVNASTALLVVDMQAGAMRMAPDSPLASGYPEIADYWSQRIDQIVVPNIQRLIGEFRRNNRKIVFTRNGNLTTTGDEMAERLKAKFSTEGPRLHRGSPGYQIDKRLAPSNADLVIDKLTSGSFTAGMLDHSLRNMGIRGLVITGQLTDACVFGTARSAAELGYDSLLCEDACATLTRRAHEEALLMHARIFGRVETTGSVLAELGFLTTRFGSR